ncbi:MAG TPA: hypothetical protein VJ851_06040 [Jatrophihabitans sp.]|nr:hypothetical protein [Jatrophihabitans sp.]
MSNDNRVNGSGPSEPGDTPANWRPSHERPWRPAGPDSVLYVHDEGQPWCGDRQFHPQFQHDDYPNPDHHWTECRSYGGAWPGWFEDARAGLNGPPGYLSAYLAKPFLFGRPRYAVADLADLDVRLALEFYPFEAGTADPFRCSIAASSIRNLAAHLGQTADVWDGWRPPRHVRQTGR